MSSSKCLIEKVLYISVCNMPVIGLRLSPTVSLLSCKQLLFWCASFCCSILLLGANYTLKKSGLRKYISVHFFLHGSMSTVGLIPYSLTNAIVCLAEFIPVTEDVKGNIIHWTLPFAPTPATLYITPPLSLYPLHISSDATQMQDVLNQVSCCLLGLHVLWFSVSTDCMPRHNLPLSNMKVTLGS